MLTTTCVHRYYTGFFHNFIIYLESFNISLIRNAIIMKTPFWFLLLLLFHFSVAQGQESAKTHTIKKGETVYQIGRLYDVSPKEILKLNPNSKGTLYVGTVLILPPNSKIKNSTYSVAEGDTTYSLSEKFNISTTELEKLNPHIKNGLQVGQTLILPDNTIVNTSSPQSKNTTTVKAGETHTISKGETLYSISKMYNVSVNDLKSVNPNINQNDLIIGSKINIPESGTKIVTKSITPVTKTNIEPKQPEKVVSDALYSGGYINLNVSADKSQAKNILFLSPFTEEEFTIHEQNSINFTVITDAITKRDLEFYRGAQMAIDSAKAIGLNINVNQFEIETSRNKKKSNTDLGTLENVDLVIAPFYENDIDWVNALALEKNIPVLCGFSASSNSSFTNIYEGLPSIDYQKLIMLDYLDEKNNTISVIVDSDRNESRQFILKNKPSATIIEADKNGNYSNKDLISSFSKTKMNYVIIDSKKTGVFLSATNLLLHELSNYRIQLVVLEASLIPSSEEISPKRFKILKLLYPEVGQISDNPATAAFLRNYKKQYGIEATEHVLFGFDLTFDSLLRSFQKKNFEESAKTDRTVYLNFKFNYKKNNKNRYINNEIRIVEYGDAPFNNDDD